MFALKRSYYFIVIILTFIAPKGFCYMPTNIVLGVNIGDDVGDTLFPSGLNTSIKVGFETFFTDKFSLSYNLSLGYKFILSEESALLFHLDILYDFIAMNANTPLIPLLLGLDYSLTLWT